MSAGDKIVSAWSALTGFLAKHIGDLNAVSEALTTVNNALPIDLQDKQRISDAIAAVQTSANNIENWLAGAPANASEVVVRESDLEAAVANYLASDAGKAAIAAAVAPAPAPSAEGNGNA